jgi:hypothetical protein
MQHLRLKQRKHKNLNHFRRHFKFDGSSPMQRLPVPSYLFLQPKKANAKLLKQRSQAVTLRLGKLLERIALSQFQ